MPVPQNEQQVRRIAALARSRQAEMQRSGKAE
jgi:hypothetical protein